MKPTQTKSPPPNPKTPTGLLIESVVPSNDGKKRTLRQLPIEPRSQQEKNTPATLSSLLDFFNSNQICLSVGASLSLSLSLAQIHFRKS
ncbi:hypothetical protein CMV_017492 [Castanea mollissima]|uniref:Uncharacterized protein n=1 Tax=Castanea mollissima TaxID=60419 RepID=A0A8J4QQX1_9ROSI|nr:hypothetical protein CMV_017492 [Castanea mollissima]